MSEGEQITFENARFGQLTIAAKSVVSFPQGLPGFERYKKYGLVEIEEETPFVRLLSVEVPHLGFVLVNPMLIWPDYNPDIGKEDLEGLEIGRAEELAIYCIVTLSAKPEEVTANLRGPICLNVEKMRAKQLILVDERYHTKHSILAAGKEHS